MVKVGWRAKAMYLVFALALVFGLSAALVPAQPPAKADVPGPGSFTITYGEIASEEGFTDPLTGLTFDYVAGYFVGANSGIPVGPYYAQMDWAIDDDLDSIFDDYTGSIYLKMWIDTDRIDFVGAWVGDTSSETVDIGTGTLRIEDPMDDPQLNPWDYNSTNVSLDFSGSVIGFGSFDVQMDGQIGVPQVLPDFSLDVKTAIQKYILVNVPLFDLDRDVDGNVTDATFQGLTAQQFANWIVNIGLESALEDVQDLENVWQIVEWKVLFGVNITNIDIVAGGKGIVDSDYSDPPPYEYYGDSYIEIRSMEPGDVHITAVLMWPYYESYGEVTDYITEEQEYELTGAEKKWGVIDKTILDLDPELEWWLPSHPADMPFDDVGNPNADVQAMAGSPGDAEFEWFSDFVYAWYYSGDVEHKDVGTAGHAIVTWWLIEDDDAGENEAAILDIMDWLNNYDGDGDGIPDVAPLPGDPLPTEPHGLGKYALPPAPDPEEMIDAVHDGVHLVYAPKGIDIDPATPDDANLNGADFTVFDNVVDGFYYLDNLGTKLVTVTQDSFPFETRGLSMSHAENIGAEAILVVTLAEYPTSKHGENPASVEMGWKRYGPVPEIDEVKTPQLRWAGEKIVLEKDWFDVIGGGDDKVEAYIAVYHLEEQSVGEISIAGDNDCWELSEGDIWVLLDTGQTPYITEVILESEIQGEADINVKLYPASQDEISGEWYIDGPPLVNFGFVVYFMAFEDVTLAEDITPPESLRNLDPVTPPDLPGEDGDVAVQVRGWFTSSALPGTDRPAVLDEHGLVYLLPAGRYVMPDDWWALANYNFDLRSNMDLMDQAHMDDIAADTAILAIDALGPFDSGVWTTLDPPLAERPTIGPFSSLQEWSSELMWISQVNAPTSLDGFAQRNTVVPDGIPTEYDAPMPEALVIFDVQPGSAVNAALTDLAKWALGPKVGPSGMMPQGYGCTACASANPVFESPFYASEIPSHSLIPDIDYDWGSWPNRKDMDPYPFWQDLLKKSVGDSESGIGTPARDINHKDLEVYSDNHGIAAVTVEALNLGGTVTLVATAEYPAALKKGKYGPVSSDDIPLGWGAVEINPFFVADREEIVPEEVVTFTNMSQYGCPDYVLAEWDLDNDGVFDVTKSGTHLEVMGDVKNTDAVTNPYAEPGVYTVMLCMTDQCTRRCETRENYIIVTEPGEPPPVPTVEIDLPWGTDVDPTFFNAFAYPPGAVQVDLTDADILASMPAELNTLWRYDGPAGWFWFSPAAPGAGTFTTLDPGVIYYAIVDSACEWGIPQE